MRTVLHELSCDGTRVAIPHAEAHIVARFVGGDVELHAIGARERVHRKLVRGTVRLAMARLPLGGARDVLGTSAAALAGAIVPLEQLWGSAASELRDQLAHDPSNAARLIDHAIASRAAAPRATVALAAAEGLRHAPVGVVARSLGVSERQLRRVFRDAIGVSPKAFARLARFHRAVDAARQGASWTRIAAATGFCDQAHLIDDFHAITGTTPRVFMTELADAVG